MRLFPRENCPLAKRSADRADQGKGEVAGVVVAPNPLLFEDDHNAQLPEAVYYLLCNSNIPREPADALHVDKVEFLLLRIGAHLLETGAELIIRAAFLIGIYSGEGQRLICFDHVLVDLVLGFVAFALTYHSCGCADVGNGTLDLHYRFSLYFSYNHTRILLFSAVSAVICFSWVVALTLGTVSDSTSSPPAVPLSSVFPPAGTLYLDADRSGRPAFRNWQAGDWMVPLGMQGRKKLSDLFVDLKLTARDKARALVIPYPGEKDRVAALVGHRIDDTLKITSRTRQVLIVSLPE